MLLFVCFSRANAQDISSTEDSDKKSNTKTIDTIGDTRHYYGIYGLYGSSLNRRISLDTAKQQIESMKEDIKSSEEYGEVKKMELLKRLDKAEKQLRSSDLDKNGYLNRQEQRLINEKIFINRY
jgi:flagellar motility protein MotE (MotC chaperone)